MNHKETNLNVEVARICGVNAAVVASKLWESQADSEAVRYVDGYPWIRASYKRLTVKLPFLTVHMVRRAVKKLLKEGVIKVGVYNDSKFDHTHSNKLAPFCGYCLPEVMKKLGIRQEKEGENGGRQEEGGSTVEDQRQGL